MIHMTLEDLPRLLVAFVAGIAIGTLYFGGLWLTIRQLPTTRHPALLLLGSYLARISICLLAFFTVMGGRWERLLACLAGFLVARTVLLRLPDRHSVSQT